jgi:hypothetical protein
MIASYVGPFLRELCTPEIIAPVLTLALCVLTRKATLREHRDKGKTVYQLLLLVGFISVIQIGIDGVKEGRKEERRDRQIADLKEINQTAEERLVKILSAMRDTNIQHISGVRGHMSASHRVLLDTISQLEKELAARAGQKAENDRMIKPLDAQPLTVTNVTQLGPKPSTLIAKTTSQEDDLRTGQVNLPAPAPDNVAEKQNDTLREALNRVSLERQRCDERWANVTNIHQKVHTALYGGTEGLRSNALHEIHETLKVIAAVPEDRPGTPTGFHVVSPQ